MVQNGRLSIRVGIFSAFIFLTACAQPEKETVTATESKEESISKLARPDFSSDSAYAFIEKQVAFGPRVPNTEAHRKTAAYLSQKLQGYGFELNNQKAQLTAFDGSVLNITNIIAEYKKENNNRILLFAHWDTRPFADQDDKDKNLPFDGANDGGSGVGVLLEVARQIQLQAPDIGVDIIFFDAEDYGQPSGSMHARKSSSSWCLGSQYWSNNKHRLGYRANFGILLDMVGGKDALFPKEAISMAYAPYVVDKVWKIAHQLGHSNHFINREVQFVGEDDHLYVNKIANIPSIDIIEYDPSTGAFNKSWHTHDDNMEGIDKATLQAVGETVMAVVLEEGK